MAKAYAEILRDMAKDVAAEAELASRLGSIAKLQEIAEAMGMLADRWPADSVPNPGGEFEYRVEFRNGGDWQPFRAYGAVKQGRIYQTIGHAKSAIKGHLSCFSAEYRERTEHRILRRPVASNWEVVE